MSIACVINTNALAVESGRLSSGRVPYADRAWLMRNVILPCYTSWNAGMFEEIVVVGEYEPGPGYTYVEFPSVYHNCADALLKRQAGFECLKLAHEWVVFQHDDHLYDPVNAVFAHEAASVLSPSRWTRARATTGEALNDGSAAGHLNGHVCLMRPSVLSVGGFNWAQLPPVFTWDVEATARLRNIGQSLRYAPELKSWDMERGATPWL